MEFAGGAAGAALGFIHGNVAGAKFGYELGRYLGRRRKFLSQNNRNNMPPVRTPKRSRINPNPFYTPRSTSRASSIRGSSSSMSVATSRSLGGRSIRSTRGAAVPASHVATNVLASAMKKKGKKVKKEGRKKKVRVSPRFRKMVNQVLSSKGPVGLMMETVPQQILHAHDNTQNVFFADNRQISGVVGWKFTPTYINYCYDMLYCNGTFPINAGINIDRYTPSFNDNQQIHVLEQYYIVKMKNNTARTLEIKLWDISPKTSQTNGSIQSIINTINDGLVDNSPVGTTGNRGTQGRENPASVGLYTIGFKPTLMTSFNKLYSLDETIIKLEPGKEYYHKVKGPNDKLYKFNAYKKNGVPFDVTPFAKTTLICLNTDLCATSLIGGGRVGRWTDVSVVGPYGLLFETTNFTKIKCPDQTGFQRLSAATNPLTPGTVQELSQKGYAYIIKNWYSTQESLGSVVDIEDENPQAQAVNGL